jgi:hypothetical protein
MPVDWPKRHRALEKWLDNKEGPIQQFGVEEIQEKFESIAQGAIQGVNRISNQLLVFTPVDWESEDDWLLSKDQWNYLMVLA